LVADVVYPSTVARPVVISQKISSYKIR